MNSIPSEIIYCIFKVVKIFATFITSNIRRKVCFSVVCVLAFSANNWAEELPVTEVPPESSEEVSAAAASPLSKNIEDVKKAALELNRDLLILVEELLFPSDTQISVFLSLDVGEYFRLDAVKLKIDNKTIASHLYTKRQNSTLERGGIQRLYMGNVKSGSHQVTAVFHGIGPDNREYKRAASITVVKGEDPILLEVRVRDSSDNMQPEFDFKEWTL